MFFYSFMSMVFLVILNFLLAIVVDAFADEKRDVDEHEQSMFTELKNILSRWCRSATSAEFRERQSLKALRNRILHKMNGERKTARSPYLVGKHDFEPAEEHWTPVKVLAMLDETYKVQLDEALLTRILKSDPDAPVSPDDLAEVAVAAFGRNQHPSVLQEPVQQKINDPVFVKLLQLQESIEAIDAKVMQMQRNVQRPESRTRAKDNTPLVTEAFRQEKQRANVGFDASDAAATKGTEQYGHTTQPILGMSSQSLVKDCVNGDEHVDQGNAPASDETHAWQPKSSRTSERPERFRRMISTGSSIHSKDSLRASTQSSSVSIRNEGRVQEYDDASNKQYNDDNNDSFEVSVEDDDANTDEYDDRL